MNKITLNEIMFTQHSRLVGISRELQQLADSFCIQYQDRLGARLGNISTDILDSAARMRGAYVEDLSKRTS